MKVFVILVCASLSSCALYGVYGPERQEIARERLRQAGENFAQAMNNLGSERSFQQSNDRNAMLLRAQLQTDAMIQAGQQRIEERHEQLQRQLDVSQQGFDRLNESLMPLPGQ
jgi:hypothetical protein